MQTTQQKGRNMTFNGNDIGKIPCEKLVKAYAKLKGYKIDYQSFVSYCKSQNWFAEKGGPFGKLEFLLDFYYIKMSYLEKSTPKSFNDKVKKLENQTKASQEEIPYEQQLKDPRWKMFRDFVFAVKGRKCEICGSTKALQVHHLHYHWNFYAWEYSLKEVAVVCKECHKKIHQIK